MKGFVAKFRPRSLRGQLLARVFLIILFSLLFIEVFQYITLKNYLYSGEEQLLKAHLHNVDFDDLKNHGPENMIKENAVYFVEKMGDVNVSVSVIDNKGNIGAQSNVANENENKIGKGILLPHLNRSEYIKLLRSNSFTDEYRLVKDQAQKTYMILISKIPNSPSGTGLIQLASSIEKIDNTLHHQLLWYFVSSIIILLIGCLLVWHVLRITLMPMYKMTDTIEKINIEQLDVRILEENGQLEIDRLSAAFNRMLKRIEVSFEQEQIINERMRRFISDASHELRTPLTSIRGFVEILLRGATKNEEELNSSLNYIKNESIRLTKLVNELLILARSDQKLKAEMNIQDIGKIIMEISPQLKILSGQRELELELEDNIFINANKDQIKQVLLNVVQNAVQHTHETEGRIQISIARINNRNENTVLLSINDNGEGISKEHLDEIFGRFYRNESHRSRKHGGYGLGLSIVKSIIDSHGGDIKVESELGKGTTFLIYLKEIQ